jgi:hypothetical protein
MVEWMTLARIAALALSSAIFLSVAPVMAATGTVTVKWSTQPTAGLLLYTQTTASQTHTANSSDIFWAGNGSTTSGCNGTIDTVNAGTDASPNLTVNFGNVTPDGVQYTNCLETNAIEAYVPTNDTHGVDVSAAAIGVPVAYDQPSNGSLLCIIPDGTWNTGSATVYTASARSAAIPMSSTTACSSGFAITTSSAGLIHSTVAATQDLNSDLQLNLGPNSTVGAASVTLVYTVVAN